MLGYALSRSQFRFGQGSHKYPWKASVSEGKMGQEPVRRAKDAQPGRLLSLEEAARYLGVSKYTIRDYIFSKQIQTVALPVPGSKNGKTLRRVLIDKCDLDAFIEQYKAGGE
jgi:excisionase family DNA binding protein